VSSPQDTIHIRGYDAFYGLEILEVSPDHARAQLVVRDDHKQPLGIVHGGVYASIAEGLTSFATAFVVIPEGKFVSGMSNQTSFLRPVMGGTIHAIATRKHAGRTTWVWEVEMSDADWRLCALSRMTIAIRDPPPNSEPAQALRSLTQTQNPDTAA
jgi:1,4-dihydroxy-2-naphthoyl-CoA hydrolase